MGRRLSPPMPRWVPLSVPEARRLLEVVLPLPPRSRGRAGPAPSGAASTKPAPAAASTVIAPPSPALTRRSEAVVVRRSKGELFRWSCYVYRFPD